MYTVVDYVRAVVAMTVDNELGSRSDAGSTTVGNELGLWRLRRRNLNAEI
jgi:hypothetical protein